MWLPIICQLRGSVDGLNPSSKLWHRITLIFRVILTFVYNFFNVFIPAVFSKKNRYFRFYFRILTNRLQIGIFVLCLRSSMCLDPKFWKFKKKNYVINTRYTSKWPKTAVTEIGHVTGYAFKLQNGPIIFSLSFWPILKFEFQNDSKLRNGPIPRILGLGHFEVWSHFEVWDILNFKMAQTEGEKIIGQFWSLNAYSVTWPISVTAVLGHFEVYLVVYIIYTV